MSLSTAEIVRERMEPIHGDPDYILLGDLRLALEPFRLVRPERVLDFGAGVSPYRSLFPGAPYHRADLNGNSGADYIIGRDSVLPISDRNYDLVLSTQVLEHVQHPAGYVKECFRVLKPGGRLLITTHGSYEDHGCPYDFHRWTADGLKVLLEQTGFQVRRVQKVTCGARALFYLVHWFAGSLYVVDRSLASLGLRFVRRLFQTCPRGVHRFCDRTYSDQRVVDASVSSAKFYIGLLCEGVRPAD